MKNTNELKKNKFKIISDPYSREITYYYWNSENEEWCSPADSSPFSKEEFTEAALYHKAYDIIENALGSYGGNVGLEIYFEGTADEFNTLSGIAGDYFSGKGIDIIKGGCYLNPVREVRRNIDGIFKDMKDTFDEYNSSPAKDSISKYEDTMSDTIPICVMGLYSTGKSAFINSLLGVEILPSADDPTTAKTFKISVGPKYSDYSISFRYQDESTPETPIRLECSGADYNLSQNKSIDIVSKLDEEMKKFKRPYDRMYNALKYINGYDKEYNRTKTENDKPWRVSPLIEVTLPLEKAYTVLPVDKYDFVIYDTPGSDTASNIDHKEVLKEAMCNQTNGLPMYVITSEGMDRDANVELIKTLKELGTSLDRNNLMIAVNKSDGAHVKELESKKNNFDNLAVSRLNPAGTYFVSSIMGLGSKMLMTKRMTTAEIEDNDTGEVKLVNKPCFLDSGYWEIFKKNKGDFVSRQNPKALYSYNIIPKPELDKYIKSVNLGEPNERILYNSGIDAIGSAITDFAENYSLYNKCRNAGNYLSKAIALTTREIELKKQEQEELSQKLDNQLDDKTAALMQKIKETIIQKREEYQLSLSAALKHEYELNRKSLNITSYANSTLKSCRGINKKNLFTEKMKIFLEIRLSTQWRTLKVLTNDHWKAQKNDLKETLIRIIIETPTLTTEQKNILKKNIKDIDVAVDFKWNVFIQPKEIVSGFIWLKVKTDISDTCLEIFDRKTSSATKSIGEQWREAFRQMQLLLENESKAALTAHNPEMLKIKKKICDCQNAIESMNKQKNYVDDKLREIKELTEFKYKSDKEE